MKRIFFPFILLLAICNMLMGQSVAVDWGKPLSLDKGNFIQKVIGADENGFYALRTESLTGLEDGNIFLEYYSMTMKERESSNSLILPSIKGNAAFFIDMFYVNGKLILFTEVSDHSAMRRDLYVQYMSQEGTAKNQPIKIVFLSNKPEDGYTVKQAESKKEFLIIYHSSFEAYAGEAYNLKVIDDNLTETFSKEIALPAEFNDSKLVTGNYILGKSGNIYMKAKVESKTKTGRNTLVTFRNFVVVYNKLKREINNYEIKHSKYSVKDIIFNLDKEENVIVYTTATEKNKITLAAFIYYKIDPKAMLIFKDATSEKSGLYVISKTDQATIFNSKRYEKLAEHRYDFTLKDVVILENGSSFLICENFFYTTKKMVDPKTREEAMIYYSYYNDLIVVNANAAGQIVGTKDSPQKPFQIISKSQSGTNEFGFWSSYFVSNQGSKIKIVFNDVSKQAVMLKSDDKIKDFKTNVATYPAGSACVVTIYSDGSMEKDYLFADPHQDYTTTTKTISPFGSSFVIMGQNGKEIKFGSFFFE